MKRIYSFLFILISLSSIQSIHTFTSIKCNKNLTIGSIELDELKAPTEIVSKLLKIQSDQIEYVTFENKSNLTNSLVSSQVMNPFINSLHLAFAEHLIVKITPDVIWYLIIDSVAVYIKQNSEKMRNVFVDFNEKRTLKVKTAPEFTWEEVISVFNDLLDKNTKHNDTNLFGMEFTTTSVESLTVSRLARMDSMQNYFTYEVYTFCGIPEIQLHGERYDWTLLIKKFNNLVSLIEDLKQWQVNLNEILNEFVRVYDGQIDEQFWRNIYKINGSSGKPWVTGWAINFFPYLSKQARNKYTLDEYWKSAHPSLTADDFNPKMSMASFEWYNRQTKTNMTFFGGLFGIKYNDIERSLLPVFGYGVYKN